MMNNARQQLDKTMTQIDKELLELQIISAVSSLKENHPDHPFVIAIRAVLESCTNPYQMNLDL